MSMYKRVLVLKSPNTNRTQTWSSQQQLIEAFKFHNSCRFRVWYLAEQVCSGTDVHVLHNKRVLALISYRTNVFWYWCTRIAQQACFGTHIYQKKRVLALISYRTSVFWYWCIAQQACSCNDILHNKRVQALISIRQSVFWHWYLTEQACSGTDVLHNKCVLVTSCTINVFRHWYLSDKACFGTDILQNKRVLTLISCTRSALKR